MSSNSLILKQSCWHSNVRRLTTATLSVCENDGMQMRRTFCPLEPMNSNKKNTSKPPPKLKSSYQNTFKNGRLELGCVASEQNVWTFRNNEWIPIVIWIAR